MHQDSLTFLDAAAAKEVEGGEGTDGECRSSLVADTGGSDDDHPVVGDADVLGVGPGEGDAPESPEDLVTDGEVGDVVPASHHDAGGRVLPGCWLTGQRVGPVRPVR